MTDAATLTIVQQSMTTGATATGATASETLLFHLHLPTRVGALVASSPIDASWRRALEAELTGTVRQIYDFAAFAHTKSETEPNAGSQDPLLGPGWQIWQLLPLPIQQHIRLLPTGATLLFVTDDLTIPWELAYDGDAYLALRLCTTRVPLNHPLSPPTAPAPPDQWKALLLGNPTGDLPFASEEIDELDKLMAPLADPIFSRRVNKKIVSERLRSSQYHLIHYLGHVEATAEGEAALLLAGKELLTVREITALLHGRP